MNFKIGDRVRLNNNPDNADAVWPWLHADRVYEVKEIIDTEFLVLSGIGSNLKLPPAFLASRFDLFPPDQVPPRQFFLDRLGYEPITNKGIEAVRKVIRFFIGG